jgi:hypothetical protein
LVSSELKLRDLSLTTEQKYELRIRTRSIAAGTKKSFGKRPVQTIHHCPSKIEYSQFAAQLPNLRQFIQSRPDPVHAILQSSLPTSRSGPMAE